MLTFTQPPGGDQPGVIGLKIVDGLLDLLVQKGSITPTEANLMLNSVVDNLGRSTSGQDKACANIVRDAIPK